MKNISSSGDMDRGSVNAEYANSHAFFSDPVSFLRMQTNVHTHTHTHMKTHMCACAYV